MTLLIVAVAFGLLFAVLATQNTNPVTVQAGNFIFRDIPLYMVVLFSLLGGLIIGWMFNFFGWAANALTLSGKDSEIKRTHKETEHLQNRVHELEVENTRLRGDVQATPTHHKDENIANQGEHQPSSFRNFFDRFRSRPSV